VQGRAGGGVRAMVLTDRSGQVAVARVVHPDDDLVVISNKGLVIRMFAVAVNLLRRPAQGVSVMSMKGKDGVASIARIPADGDPAEKHGGGAQQLDEALGTPTAVLAVSKARADGNGASGDDNGH